MRHVTYYHQETGLLHAWSHLVSDDAAVALNTPKGHEAIDHPQGAMLDSLSQRVDVDRLVRVDQDALTAWAAKRDAQRLQRTIGGTPDEPDEPPPRSVATLAHVVDYQPPQPSASHEWHAPSRRWVLTASERDAQQKGRDSLARRRELESAQATHLRRMALNPQDAKAREALQQIEDELSPVSGEPGRG